MKKHLILLFFFLGLLPLSAQTDKGEQVLVFRNTGEVNLFFSSQLDSIGISRFDASGKEYDNCVSQIFYSQDTVMVVPISEIDSVAFGARNETVFNKDVHILNEADLLWITNYNGEDIYYKLTTPRKLLPKEGEKLFYGDRNSFFVNGLAVKVNSVKRTDNAYVINVSKVDVKDIFARLFYAGSADTQDKTVARSAKMGGDMNGITFFKDFNVEFDGNNASLGVDYGMEIRNSYIVANPLAGYYSYRADLHHSLETTMSVETVKKDFTKEWESVMIPLGCYAMVFTPKFYLKPFINLNAELSCKVSLERNMVTHVEYTQQRGKSPSLVLNTTKAGGENRAKADFVCEGELYVGVMPMLDFNILLETAGVRAKLRFGPCLNSEFGFASVRKLAQDYNPEDYGKAKLSTCLRLNGEATYYTRNWLTNEEKENVLFSFKKDYLKKEYSLLPIPLYSKAVRPKLSNKDVVEIALKIKPDSLMEDRGELGFKITDANKNCVDSCYIKSGESHDNNKLCYSTEVDITSKTVAGKKIDIRPVVHYAGYTLWGDTIPINSRMPIQPMVFALCNGTTMVLSGMPYSGETSKADILYKAGPKIPIPIYDKDFGKTHSSSAFNYIGSDEEEWLLGQWEGNESYSQVTYIFCEDNSGTFKNSSGTYRFDYYTNYPQSGKLTLFFDFGSSVVLNLNSITDRKMNYMRQDSKQSVILTKK